MLQPVHLRAARRRRRDVNSRVITTQASIAFVSSDKDSKAWASYYQSMGENWLSSAV